MSRKAFKYSALLASVLLAAALGGCGSDSRDSGASLDSVAKVGDTACIQCHSAVTEALTGESIVAQYQQNSPHNQDGLGCESCHGGGAMHNGVGPIPYPAPDATRCATCHDGVTSVTVAGVATVAPATNSTEFATSNHATGTPSHTTTALCTRCHTHETAVLSNQTGYTGELASGTIGATTYPGVLDNAAYGPPVVTTGYTAFKCETCHQHGAGLRGIKARDINGNVVLWNPSKSGRTDQFNLCTSCHNLYNYNQTRVIASNTAASGTLKYEHNTRWNRTLVSTHKEKTMVNMLTLPFANMTSMNPADHSNTLITGYALRLTNTTDASYKGPCFDCHGHESKTNTGGSAPAAASSTIHTDWAQSGHAGGLLTAKYAAGAGSLRTAAEVDAVTAAYVDTNTSTWSHYNWDDNSTRGDCQMCHTATGISNYLVNQTTDLTGYVATSSSSPNTYSHLASWNATGGSNRQNELLYCWGCHKDAGTGALRNTTQAILSFTYNSQPILIAGTGKSTACVVCHGGRGSATEGAVGGRSSRFNGHHAPTAGVLYSAQTHIGYEYAGLSYANPSFFAHDKIGLNADGACASCHMAPAASDGKPSHTFASVTLTGTTITAINNQALCNTCHTPGGQYEMTPTKLEEEKAGYTQASTILNNYVSNLAGYLNYLGYAITSSNYNNQVPAQPVSDNDYGAYQNGKLISDEPCAYVHNRYYAKRLVFDSIDWMDNGVLNGTISIDATTYPDAALWFGAPAGTTGAYTASRP